MLFLRPIGSWNCSRPEKDGLLTQHFHFVENQERRIWDKGELLTQERKIWEKQGVRNTEEYRLFFSTRVTVVLPPILFSPSCFTSFRLLLFMSHALLILASERTHFFLNPVEKKMIQWPPDKLI